MKPLTFGATLRPSVAPTTSEFRGARGNRRALPALATHARRDLQRVGTDTGSGPLDAFPKLTVDTFKGSPIETEYKRLSPSSSASSRWNRIRA